jgi:hypothetical protein
VSTIGRHYRGSTRDAFAVACDYCGVSWPRFKLRRDGAGLFACPDEGDGRDARTLDRLNAATGPFRQPAAADAPVAHARASTAHIFSDILGDLYANELRATAPEMVLGTGVKAWPDMNLRDFARQDTTTRQPALDLIGFNGGPCVTSTGVELLSTSFTRPIGKGRRPYLWVVFSRTGAVGTTNEYVCSLGTPSVGYEPVYNGGTFRSWRQDSSGAFVLTDSAVALDTNRHLFAGGLTVGGTASMVLDGVPFNSTRTGQASTFYDRLALFAESTNGTSPSNGSKTKIALFLLANDMPTDTQKAAVVAAITGANWPEYTNASFGLTVAP